MNGKFLRGTVSLMGIMESIYHKDGQRATSCRQCGCPLCHTQIIRGEGVTLKDKCFYCHVDRSDKIGDVKLIHEKHVGKKQVDCLWCLDLIEHGKTNMSKTAM